ncbi:uncharacterized protein LOC111341267 [Stylophora pistillata]|uniref:uncharacterized protein LOC111341267 n=1 Tax=Stylophora pistillata TaxID=50429 RepID=UPI000C03D318|nr:uncharacterized protein LOC111341267 [Stylophora pistillata]
MGPGLQFKLNDFSSASNIGLPKQPDPQCHQKSFERELCGDFKSPFITPDKCLNAGCCYDDIFMNEPGLQWHSPNASLWCFNKRKGADTGVMTTGTMSFQSAPPASKENDFKILQTQSQSEEGGESCYANSCYMISEAGESWDENRKNCKASGGDLVSLETEAEWQFVNGEIQKMKLQGANEWHIGLKKQGDWKWVSGSPMTIKKWQRYEPSGDGNVVVMSKDYPPGSQGLFNDVPGEFPKPFICELPKGAGPQPGPQNPSKPPMGPTEAPAASSSPTSSASSAVQPTSNPTTQPAGGATPEMTGFEKDCLKAHNEYRAKHGVPPLKWSAELAADAQEWANELTVKNMMEHDMDSINNKGQGENLAYFHPGNPDDMPTQCQGPKTQKCVQCREMVADWYAEESNFEYNTGKSKGGVILHFTQVVWKETTELGMATATSATKWFSVARYKPRGNMGYPADYIENVPRPQVNV